MLSEHEQTEFVRTVSSLIGADPLAVFHPAKDAHEIEAPYIARRRPWNCLLAEMEVVAGQPCRREKGSLALFGAPLPTPRGQSVQVLLQVGVTVTVAIVVAVVSIGWVQALSRFPAVRHSILVGIEAGCTRSEGGIKR